MMTKDGFTKMVNFMSPGAGIVAKYRYIVVSAFVVIDKSDAGDCSRDGRPYAYTLAAIICDNIDSFISGQWDNNIYGELGHKLLPATEHAVEIEKKISSKFLSTEYIFFSFIPCEGLKIFIYARNSCMGIEQ